jgi:hypothetical protein
MPRSGLDRYPRIGVFRRSGMLKRMADWFEKVSVTAFAVGIFYDQPLLGLSTALGTLAVSLVLTRQIGG